MQTMRTRFLPKAVAVELRRLPWRVLGFSLLILAAAGWLALVSWSFEDPSPNNATVSPPHNWLGYRGASFADTMMGGFGLASPLFVFPLAALGFHIATGYSPLRLKVRLAYWGSALLFAPAFFACLHTPPGWLPGTGLGGISGDFAAGRIAKLPSIVPPIVLWPISALLFLIAGAWCVWRACGLSVRDLSLAFEGGADESLPPLKEGLGAPEQNERPANRATSWVKQLFPRNRALVPSGPREFWMSGAKSEPSLSPAPAGKPQKVAEAPAHRAPSPFARWGAAGSNPAAAEESTASAINAAEDLAAFQSSHYGEHAHADRGTASGTGASSGASETVDGDDFRIEPFFGPSRSPAPAGDRGGEEASGEQTPVSPFLRLTGKAAKAANASAQRIFTSVANGIKPAKPLIYVKGEPAAPAGRPEAREVEQEEDEDGTEDFCAALPALSLLAPAPEVQYKRDAADPLLMQRAAALMGVLGDFGVKGRISGIYPGPVITLFELEPARGTKSSRVAGLADDIARSMSAVSARIAVVPGRDAIGIELPNPKREIVSLRAILESTAFQNSQAALPLALGKSIGGEPIAVDLARMPHLLIAGTTGSGKSVGINAMILSLLFRLPPSQCNFIMIDPKMLELSAYDGIPHLLAPVVTDPKKAVTALKWAVKEMNSRYERMSKLGVRNVTAYNARVAAAQLRGQPLRRTIQTGFHPITGEPMEEEEIIDPVSMPYLVIVIDEMADLMMCAGKDVEFAVQRLSQMARAAGIHLIMATQRPSVDVVTGTIKANFPSRISFQVTSKIDSRTIIGEQGAEQLLGAGDMLYMASGGRIVRAHGPFVSDEEVEAVARHLKAQGFPSYRDDILEDSDGFEDAAPSKANGDGDLYGQAVEIVLKDRKPTTSYLQRRLNIGYNRAASLIERMEEEGIVGAPGRTGRREILADAGQ
ncbi:MAG: DNA translocase FtsK 4TM domain-containing protein [Rhodomicrobium sp.]